MPTTTPDHPATPTSPWLRRGGRLLLLGWVAFLTWFVLADMATEGIAKEPVLLLAALWLAGGTAWVAPRPGGVLLFAFAAVAAWIFRAPAGLVMLVLPPVACGTLLWLASARRHDRPTTGRRPG